MGRASGWPAGRGLSVLRERSQGFHSLLIMLDVVLSGTVVIFLVSGPPSLGLRPSDAWALTPSFLAVALVACLAWPLTLQQLGLYDSQRRTPFDELMGQLAMAGFLATGVLTLTAQLTSAPLPPKFPFLFGAAQFSILMTERVILFGMLRIGRRFGRNTRNVLVVGSGPRAAAFKRRIDQNPHWGLRIVGYLDDADGQISPEIDSRAMRKMIDVRRILRDEVVDEVVIAAPRSIFAAVVPVVAACGEAGVPFTLLSDIFGDYLPPPRVTRFGALTALRFATVHHSAGRLAIKRAIDLVGASALAVATLPLVAAAALAIRATSPGPILFRQLRCGLQGRRFQMVKLRTMVVGAEERRHDLAHLNEMSGPAFKMRNDPRVTSVGRWLRRLSIDELPQLWNVLRGEMSLVGPRPPLPLEVAQYETFERRRLSMRPGITCSWQVSGRNQINDFDDWVRLDLEYIDTWSIAQDLRILALTIPAVLKATGE